MPRFYGVTNNNAPEGPAQEPRRDPRDHPLPVRQEHPAAGLRGGPGQGRPGPRQGPVLSRRAAWPATPTRNTPPDSFTKKDDKGARRHPTGSASTSGSATYAKANFGPNLSNIAVKFQSKRGVARQGYKWLANWIKAPETYHPKSLMPNLQLSWQDAADIAAWIMSVPGEWPGQRSTVPDVDSAEVKQGPRRAGQAVRLQGGLSPSDGKHDAVPLSEVDEFVGKELSPRREADVPRREDDRPARLLRLPQHPRLRERQADRHPAQRLGRQEPDEARLRPHRRVPRRPAGRRHGATATAPTEYYQEKLAEHTRSASSTRSSTGPGATTTRRRTRTSRPGTSGCGCRSSPGPNDPKAIEEVMTFVLGLTGEKIAARYLPKTHYTPGQNGRGAGVEAAEPVQLHRLPRPGDAQVHDRGRARSSRRRSPTSQTNVDAAVQQPGATDYLKEFYPELDVRRRRRRPTTSIEAARPSPTTARRSTIEGMPARATRERARRVQLWRPVTIRGYTFNVGDTLIVDQTKVKVTTPPTAATSPGSTPPTRPRRPAAEFADLWNRLPPPLAPRGEEGADPLADRASSRTRTRSGPAANLRMPRFHYGRSTDSPKQDETARPGQLLRRPRRRRVPLSGRSPSASRRTSPTATPKHPDYLAGGWTDDDQGGSAS